MATNDKPEVQPTPAKPAPIARERIPFNNFTKKLEVKQGIPGYHLYWFLDEGDRIPRAQAGGYEFVARGEVGLNAPGVTDGEGPDSRVRRLAGRDAIGQPIYHYLMKIPEALWQEDQQALEAHNEAIRQALLTGAVGNEEHGASYTGERGMTAGGIKVPRGGPGGQQQRPATVGQPTRQSRFDR